MKPHRLIALVALWLPGAGIASESAGVTHNPFARPVLESRADAGTFAPRAPGFRLRATMAAGEDSLVNVDGRIVAIGGLVAGYRLVAVGEGTAVFVRNGVRYKLALTPRAAGDQG